MYTAKVRIAPSGRRVLILERWYAAHVSTYKLVRMERPATIAVCGLRCADEKAKAPAAKLREVVGFDPVDAGSLGVAQYSEPFALLVAQLAHEGSGGPELAYRFERVGKSR